MSKLARLREAIELLDKVEELLGDVRYAYEQESAEREALDRQFEVVGDASYIIKTKVLAKEEAVLYLAAHLDDVMRTQAKGEQSS